MSDDTAQRLQEAAAKCLSSLDAWNKNLSDDNAREGLIEAVHDLRRVTSRLEIDIAMNDRKSTNSKPIPIPEHKSKTEKKTQKPLSEILPVAEMKENRAKRKIEIENQNDEDENNASDDDHNHADNQSNDKPRKPRRKKRESNNQGNE